MSINLPNTSQQNHFLWFLFFHLPISSLSPHTATAPSPLNLSMQHQLTTSLFVLLKPYPINLLKFFSEISSSVFSLSTTSTSNSPSLSSILPSTQPYISLSLYEPIHSLNHFLIKATTPSPSVTSAVRESHCLTH